MSALAFMNGVYPKETTDVKFYPDGKQTFTDQDVQRNMDSELIKDKSTPVTGSSSLAVYGTFPMMEIKDMASDCPGMKH